MHKHLYIEASGRPNFVGAAEDDNSNNKSPHTAPFEKCPFPSISYVSLRNYLFRETSYFWNNWKPLCMKCLRSFANIHVATSNHCNNLTMSKERAYFATPAIAGKARGMKLESHLKIQTFVRDERRRRTCSPFRNQRTSGQVHR